jgi:hypothetical protein
VHNDEPTGPALACSSRVADLEPRCPRGATSRNGDGCRLALELVRVGIDTASILGCLEDHCGLRESAATRALEWARAKRWAELAC